MTSLAEGDGRTVGWRRRLVWIGLALSLILNICFIGGVVWTRTRLAQRPFGAAPALERIQQIGDGLGLSADQRLAFDQFLRVIRERSRFVRESDTPLIQRLWAEEAKPAPDAATLARLSGQIADDRAGFGKEARTAFDGFIATLDPGQRKKLADVALAPPDPPTRRLFQMIVP